MTFVLYGATGTTGTLIAEAAVRRGHRPILAGRSPERLRPLAERLGLDWAAAATDDPAALDGLVARAPLTLLTAGPFTATSAPVLQACLRAGSHYLDVANETGVFEAVYARDTDARRRGVTLLPGAGFGVTATDTLARHVADQLPGALRLELTVLLYTAGTSPGAAANRLSIAAGGGLARHGGALVPARLGAGARRVATPAGRSSVVPLPTGDLSAVHRTTGIGDITVSMPVGLPPALARLLLPLLPRIAGRRAARERAADRPRTPLPPADPARRSLIGARAVTADGRSIQAWLQTGEGYAYTAEAAVRAAETVLVGTDPGAHSPGALLGADFALDIPGVRRLGTEPAPSAPRT
ncbi:saccharopine dehydrogenase [Planomonospora sphaerica]|uniref:Saccharopine dehydrogenase n=1 Tax=Planomonospora sphaerica TaxID=161355 RepID=A0A171DQY1_9ACTN|nr:saccharopine dehydrogenase NADP-binding domain-containing protein [Planomonospora sphaerica]GAT71464.1 saccharopine dehydrogenase [Planomonospora sphaerica]